MRSGRCGRAAAFDIACGEQPGILVGRLLTDGCGAVGYASMGSVTRVTGE
jgi:hypothetical protein